MQGIPQISMQSCSIFPSYLLPLISSFFYKINLTFSYSFFFFSKINPLFYIWIKNNEWWIKNKMKMCALHYKLFEKGSRYFPLLFSLFNGLPTKDVSVLFFSLNFNLCIFATYSNSLFVGWQKVTFQPYPLHVCKNVWIWIVKGMFFRLSIPI